MKVLANHWHLLKSTDSLWKRNLQIGQTNDGAQIPEDKEQKIYIQTRLSVNASDSYIRAALKST